LGLLLFFMSLLRIKGKVKDDSNEIEVNIYL
jgi:hypothetical protein